MEVVNKQGMHVSTQKGDRQKLRDLPDGSIIVPVDYAFEASKKKREDQVAEMRAHGASEA